MTFKLIVLSAFTLIVSGMGAKAYSVEPVLELFDADSIARESMGITPNVSPVIILKRNVKMNTSAFTTLLSAISANPDRLPNIKLPRISNSEPSEVREYQLTLGNQISANEWVISGSSTETPGSTLVMHLTNSAGVRATVRNKFGSMLILRENGSDYLLKSTLGTPTGHDPTAILSTVVPRLPNTISANSQSSITDPSNSVDLLVVTTSAAASFAGSASLLNQSIQAAITDTNSGFSQSGVDLQLRLVAIEPTSYIETDNTEIDLSRLMETSDGFLDEIHGLRDMHAADLVMLIIGEGDQFCGRAVWWTNGTNLLARGGFSILTEYCIATTIFAHELGHNFGLQHDRFTNNSGGFLSFAHGYTAPSEAWHTIMAYANGCNFNCYALNRWSNPAQNIDGEPLGVPIGNANSADSVSALEQTKSDVANFRVAASITSNEVKLHSSCLAGNGRVDVNVINPGAENALYRLEFGALSAREINVVPKKWSRIRISGRPPGDYQVTVKRNGMTILNSSLSIDCSTTNPQVSLPEITPMNTCLNSNGLVMFQIVNPTNTTRPYIIEFDGVPNRSTTAAPFGQAIRGTSGRPDGTYGFVIKTGGTVLHSGLVNVDCD